MPPRPDRARSAVRPLTGDRRRGPRRAAVPALAVLLLSAAGCAGAGSAAPPAPGAVLFIADGMGPAYVTATRLARGGRDGRLRLDGMPHTAIVKTWAADGPVTDSAAAASAMACGVKTVNGALCQDATAVSGRTHGARLESVAVWAKKRGMLVGIVTTTRVTHATAAAFYATHHDRDAERDLARQAIAAPVDFLLGGGRLSFGRAPAWWPKEDIEDLEAAAAAAGWRLVTTAAELGAVVDLDRKVLGLFAPDHLPYEAERVAAVRKAGAAAGDRPPGLVEMTRWAIDRVTGSGRPFLLVIEAGRPDHAGHDNRARTLVGEMEAFDEAVGAALDALDPRVTLVLATGDHEAGGLTINGYPGWSAGVWGTTQERGRRYPVLTFMTGPGRRGSPGDSPYGRDDLRPSGIALPDGLHTGVDLPLYAWGAGSGQVRGTLENTAVYHLLRAHLEGRAVDRETLTTAR
jgi:alkaline phosphatase